MLTAAYHAPSDPFAVATDNTVLLREAVRKVRRGEQGLQKLQEAKKQIMDNPELSDKQKDEQLTEINSRLEEQLEQQRAARIEELHERVAAQKEMKNPDYQTSIIRDQALAVDLANGVSDYKDDNALIGQYDALREEKKEALQGGNADWVAEIQSDITKLEQEIQAQYKVVRPEQVAASSNAPSTDMKGV